MPLDVLPVLDEFVAYGLLGVRCRGSELRHAVDDVGHEVKAVEVVHDHHVERRRGRALLLEAAHVQVPVIGAAQASEIRIGQVGAG